MLDTKIQSTTDYTIFTNIKGNREIYKPHLARLTKSISRKNMLAQNPIIVTKDYGVIDGQTRLEVAKTLQVPVYYMFVDDAGLADIQLLNANNRQWQTYDYLNSYITMGKQEYIRLKEFADQYRISIAIARRILAHENNAIRNSSFKDGNFKIMFYDRAVEIASLLTEIRRHTPDNCWAHIKLISAVEILVDEVDPTLLIQKLDQYQMTITRRYSTKDYLRQFELILKQGGDNAKLSLS